MQVDSTFHPASTQGAGILHLLRIGLGMSYVILGLVCALVFYAAYRFRAKPGQGTPPQVFGGKWAERGWTIIPLLLLASMFVLTAMTVRDTDPYVPRDTELIAIGHQWWWEFRYPHSNVVTSYELHLPAGRNLSTRLQSADVIHDFAVMQFGRKMDAIPGYWNYFWVGADRTGSFQGFCHEYCGAEHSWMLFKAIVESPADFHSWLLHQALPASAPATDEQRRGQELFEQKTCATCHSIRGSVAKGDIGPDLTHVASRSQLGSGIIDNTPSNLLKWLKNPQAIKPLVHMPNMQLSDADAHALAAYLENLK